MPRRGRCARCGCPGGVLRTRGRIAALSSPGASARFAELSHQTAVGLAEIVERQNLAMANAAERLWYEVAGEAIAARNHGFKPLDRILADAVCQLAAHGLETIDYRAASAVSSTWPCAVTT